MEENGKQKQIDKLDARLDDISERLIRIETLIEKGHEDHTKYEKQNDDIQARLKSLESDRDSMRGSLKMLKVLGGILTGVLIALQVAVAIIAVV